MTGKLADKVAVVTGGSSGIGLGIAKRFAQEGARVSITGRRQSQLDEAVASIGGNAVAIQGDTSNLADLDRVYATVKAQAGRIDVLAVNAGVYELGTLGEITEEHFDRTFNTNVRGLLFTVQKALPLLSRGASVILTGSMVSIKGFASCSVYNASKAAVRSFARTWIVDLKGRDIRVNVLSPGYTATPGLSHFMTDEERASPATSVAIDPNACLPKRSRVNRISLPP
jgi:NAD(P)-dependent dehydrogenase (short-subunit alcohol dehydrogenase family)